MADVFAREVNEIAGGEVLTPSDAESALASLASRSQVNEVATLSQDEGVTALGLTDEEVERAYQAAVQSVSTSIPVYESDGVTEIGTFTVG